MCLSPPPYFEGAKILTIQIQYNTKTVNYVLAVYKVFLSITRILGIVIRFVECSTIPKQCLHLLEETYDSVCINLSAESETLLAKWKVFSMTLDSPCEGRIHLRYSRNRSPECFFLSQCSCRHLYLGSWCCCCTSQFLFLLGFGLFHLPSLSTGWQWSAELSHVCRCSSSRRCTRFSSQSMCLSVCPSHLCLKGFFNNKSWDIFCNF